MPTNQDRARWFIKNEWRQGRIPHPKSLLCTFCPKQATEYHHHLGHERDHWSDVIPVCRKCHFQHDPAKHGILATRTAHNAFKRKYDSMKAFVALHKEEFEKFCLTTSSL